MDFDLKNKQEYNVVNLTNSEKTSHKCLSDQALGAIMMALQNSLMHQTDIIPVLKGLKLVDGPNNEIVILNPPIIRANSDSEDAKV